MKQLFLLFIVYFNIQTCISQKNMGMANIFYPDTSICNIKLENEESIISIYGDLMKFIDTTGAIYKVFLTNIEKTESLSIQFYPGNLANRFSYFRVYNTNKEKHNAIKCNYPNFQSSSGIHIGMSKNQVINILGSNYKSSTKANIFQMTYRIDDYSGSQFLQKYNAPSYEAIYSFKNNKLITFEFGFLYP